MKRHLLKLTALLLALISLLLLAGCSYNGIGHEPLKDFAEGPDAALLGKETIAINLPEYSSGRIYIPVIAGAQPSRIWLPIREGIERAAKEYNITVEFFVSENDADYTTQITAFRKALTRNPKALCTFSLDQAHVSAYLTKVSAAGVPMISLDSAVPTGCVASCKPNAISAGEDAAKRIAAAINSRGKIAIAASDWKNVTSAEMIEGFRNIISENYPKIELVNVPSNPDIGMLEQCALFFSTNPSIDAVFGADREAFECLLYSSRSLTEGGDDEDEAPTRRSIAIVGIGSGPEIEDSLRSGEVLGTYLIDYSRWGYNALTTAFRACIGGEFDSVVTTDYVWVDADNIDLSPIRKLLSN